MHSEGVAHSVMQQVSPQPAVGIEPNKQELAEISGLRLGAHGVTLLGRPRANTIGDRVDTAYTQTKGANSPSNELKDAPPITQNHTVTSTGVRPRSASQVGIVRRNTLHSLDNVPVITTPASVKVAQTQSPRSLSVQATPRSIVFTVETEELKVPPDATQLLQGWHANQGWMQQLKPEQRADLTFVKEIREERNANLAGMGPVDKNGNVLPSKDQIDKCLERFKNECNGNWQEMKESCTDKGLMQIVNDMRSSELSHCINEAGLNKDFTIINLGSTKLTSDFDFTLMDRAQTTMSVIKETEGCAKFNKVFESRWARSAATTFDSNAYTMQRSMKCTDPNIEKIRGTQQLEFSRVMANRLKSPESIEQHMSRVLSFTQEIDKPQVKAMLAKAVGKAEWAESKVKQGMMKLVLEKAVHEGSKDPIETKNLLETVARFEFFTATLEQKQAFNEVYTTVVQLPLSGEKTQVDNLRVRAENAIHNEIKGGVKIQTLESGIAIASKHIEALKKASTGQEFVEIHNKGADEIIEVLKKTRDGAKDPKEVEALDKQIKRVEDNRITDPVQGEQAGQLFQKFSELAAKRDNLVEKYSDFQSKLTRIEVLENSGIQGNTNEIAKLKNEIHVIAKDVRRLINAEIDNSDLLIFHLDSETKRLNKKLGEIEDAHPLVVNKALSLSTAKDLIIINYQKVQLEGMLFAQEAHVGEGAFDFTVRDLQAGEHKNRTLNQMVQNFNEVSAFFEAHQEHVKEGSGAEAKLVEASKYGGRLVSNIKATTTRISALNVQEPLPVDALGFKKFEDIMTTLGGIRGKGKTDDEVFKVTQIAVAKYMGTGKVPEDVTAVDVTNILREVNEFVHATSAKIEAWVEGPSVAVHRDRYV